MKRFEWKISLFNDIHGTYDERKNDDQNIIEIIRLTYICDACIANYVMMYLSNDRGGDFDVRAQRFQKIMIQRIKCAYLQ